MGEAIAPRGRCRSFHERLPTAPCLRQLEGKWLNLLDRSEVSAARGRCLSFHGCEPARTKRSGLGIRSCRQRHSKVACVQATFTSLPRPLAAFLNMSQAPLPRRAVPEFSWVRTGGAG
jgi:hypothetical protein